jgi:hypothetical protein
MEFREFQYFIIQYIYLIYYNNYFKGGPIAKINNLLQ